MCHVSAEAIASLWLQRIKERKFTGWGSSPVSGDCGGLTLAGHQVHTKAALSLTLLSWTGERKYNEGLMGRDKDREITQQLLSRARQTRFGEKN